MSNSSLSNLDQQGQTKANHDPEYKRATFTWREFMTGLIGAGVGALINHISGSRYIYFFVWIALSVWAGFHFWPLGGLRRKQFIAGASILLLLAIAVFEGEAPPKPFHGRGVDLYFALAGQSGDFPLALTNDLFRFRMDSNPFVSKPIDIKGAVVIPVLPGASNVTVEFVLKNISPYEIDRGFVKLILPLHPGNNDFILNTSWTRDRLASGPGTGFTFPMPFMNPGEFQCLPQLGFPEATADAFGVITEPIGMDVQLWQMRILPLVVPWKAQPFITFVNPVDAGNGRLHFDIPFTTITNATTGEITMIGSDPDAQQPINQSSRKSSKETVTIALVFGIVIVLIISVVIYAIRS